MLPLVPEKIDPFTLPAVQLAERDQLPNSAAIYFVLDAQQVIHYIGRTKSLCIRWRAHHRLEDFKKIHIPRIAYLIVTEANLLPAIERALIRYFEPPLNIVPISHFDFPYKLQVWLSDTLRADLKDLAHSNGLTLQKLIETILEEAVNDPPKSLVPEQKRRKVLST